MTKATAPVAAAPAAATTVVAGRTIEAPVIAAVRTDIAPPASSTNRGGKSHYDFSILTAVGASFGISNKTREQVATSVNRENKRNMTSVPDPMNPGKTIDTYSAKYQAYTVDPKTDPDGASVRVFRIV